MSGPLSEDITIEAALARLARSPDHRVLQRLQPKTRYSTAPQGPQILHGLVIDTETTGLDPKTDIAFELGMVPFTYLESGQVLDVADAYLGFQDPGRPLSAEITALTGRTDDMVRGKSFDLVRIENILRQTNLVIAYNSAFDRPHCERISPLFKAKPWGCAMSQIKWADEGISGTKLEHILHALGYFHEAHRADMDGAATLHILAQPLPRSGVMPLTRIREDLMTSQVLVMALESPYASKDILKAGKRYRWNDGENGRPRTWFRYVPETEVDVELQWLRQNVYASGRMPDEARMLEAVSAYDRFSDRVM